MNQLDPRSYKVVPGRYYDTPKEIWGFRSAQGRGSPLQIARAFLDANRAIFDLDVEALMGSPKRIVHGLGATHVILQQRWQRRRVHRAYVTVHVASSDGRVYLVKSRAAPEDVLEAAKEPRVSEASAVRRAVSRARGRGRAGVRVVGEPELLWFPAKRLLHPAWKVRVHRSRPRAEFIVYVNAESGALIQVYDNLAEARGKGRVFLPCPMARDRHFAPLDAHEAVMPPTPLSYADVVLGGLGPSGYLDGTRATTKITGSRLHKRNRDFSLESNRNRGFEEVSAYYHVDSALAYLESLGYTGQRRVFRQPVPINARGTRDDNSWYSPGDKTLTFGTGGVDDAEDGETVLHELGHAIQDAICPDFGQSLEAAAMGEGFGDYWAGSFFEAHKPRRYRNTVMTWDGATYPGDPPGVRRLDSAHTYETFEHKEDFEHENGEIWSATLWEVRHVLGRDKADRVIVDSHFQLDGFTSFAKGARAILDANDNLYGGARRVALMGIFRRRGIGPVE